MVKIIVELQSSDFSVDAVLQKLRTSRNIGCVVTFVGIVRGTSTDGKPVTSLELEAYTEMAKKSMVSLATDAKTKFELEDIAIIHRVGKLSVGENIICIAVASAHRETAFKACKWLIDELKKLVPIWKHEFVSGSACIAQ